MTAPTDRVVLACLCGSVLELPPRAAEVARSLWASLHTGPAHRPVDAAVARKAAETSRFEGFIAAAGKARRP